VLLRGVGVSRIQIRVSRKTTTYDYNKIFPEMGRGGGVVEGREREKKIDSQNPREAGLSLGFQN